MHSEELWTARTLQARALRALLTPLSWLYAVGWQCYLGIYRLGLKKPKEPHRPVVCVGNLQVGGTGKTPVTVHIADVLREMGWRVVISSSGYGSNASEAARIAPDGELRAAEWGDEASLIRWLRPEIPLIVGRRRVLAAELCHEHFPDALLLLDDGFQHLPLKKHVTIILDPPQLNRRCLPAGPYREPWANRKRADALISRFGSQERSPAPERPGSTDESRWPAVWVETKELAFQGPDGKPRILAKPFSVLCALARPRGFLDSLKARGLDPDAVVARPDHDPLTDGNLLAGLPSGRPIVVTGKDWVKLRDRPGVEEFDILIADREVSIEPHDVFRTWLRDKLGR